MLYDAPPKVFGGGGPLRKSFGFLRPIYWLKIYPSLVFFFPFSLLFLNIPSFRALKNFQPSRASNRYYNPIQIWNSAPLLVMIMLYFKQRKTDFMFSRVALKLEFWRVDFPFLNYVVKRKLMIQIQARSKVLTYEIERISKKWKEK